MDTHRLEEQHGRHGRMRVAPPMKGELAATTTEDEEEEEEGIGDPSAAPASAAATEIEIGVDDAVAFSFFSSSSSSSSSFLSSGRSGVPIVPEVIGIGERKRTARYPQ